MTFEEYTPSPEKLKERVRINTRKINKIFYYTMPLGMLISLVLATIYGNFEFAIWSSASVLLTFYGAKFFTRKHPVFHKYLTAIVLALFSLQYIFQSGNGPNVLLTFLVFNTVLILYNNWRVLGVSMLSGTVVSIFGMMSNLGYKYWGLPEIIQDTGSTGIEQGVELANIGLSIIHFTLCVLVSNYFKKESYQNIKYVLYLEEQLNIEENTKLANDIAKGVLDGEYKLNEHDMLGEALVEMRENLKGLQSQDEILRWQNKGRAHLNEVLINSNNINDLSEQLILNLVNYMGVYQGGFYVLEKDEEGAEILVLNAHYAYDVPDSVSLKYYVGEGLVGEAAKGKKTILIDNVPSNYSNIVSGLGSALPENILLVPLVFRDNVAGVVEIASFKQFKPHEVEFVEGLAESIAVTINSANSKDETSRILMEAQQMNEEMKNQEEAMRLNMEMMAEGQEEIERLNAQMSSTMQAIDSSFATIEYSTEEGKILSCNERFEEIFGYSERELQKETYELFALEGDKNTEDYKQFWKEVLEGATKSVTVNRLSKNGQVVQLRGHYSPIYDMNGELEKVMNICYDLSSDNV
ncbi:GAF domain-containing protein [Flammeovirgaceae bacterium SG7u.111]|nr:GAF domain-containing protein [Flammeovirgaceae bacterium SG7u.132]WPO37326.1 GAF domain-containing protein [Flammeovirgaceae bacterium SG7u.111]